MTTPRREQAKRAVTAAAWQPARQGCDYCDHICGPEIEPMIHCLSFAGFGIDLPLGGALDAIDNADKCVWDPHFMGHDLVVVDKDGKARRFQVKQPTEDLPDVP